MPYDVIIIGGGIAGLSTAVRCTELGLRPIVLEKGKTADYPCNARFSGGIVHVAEKEMRAPMTDILAKIDHLTNGSGSSELAKIMASDAEKALDWLRLNGAKFIKGGAIELMRWVLAPPRPRRRRGGRSPTRAEARRGSARTARCRRARARRRSALVRRRRRCR